MPGRTINSIGSSSARKRSRRDADQDEDGDEEEVVAVRGSNAGLQGESVCLEFILIPNSTESFAELT